MKRAAALGLAAMMLAGTAQARTLDEPQPLGDISGTWALFWAVLQDDGGLVSFNGAMDVARTSEAGRWDIRLSNYVLQAPKDGSPMLVAAVQDCVGVEESPTLLSVTCTTLSTTSSTDYAPDNFKLSRVKAGVMSGSIRESGGADMGGLEARLAR